MKKDLVLLIFGPNAGPEWELLGWKCREEIPECLRSQSNVKITPASLPVWCSH